MLRPESARGRPGRARNARSGDEKARESRAGSRRLSRAGISLPPTMGGPWPGAGPSGIARWGVGRGSECRRGRRSSCPGRIGQGAVAALTGGLRFCAECPNPAALPASVPDPRKRAVRARGVWGGAPRLAACKNVSSLFRPCGCAWARSAPLPSRRAAWASVASHEGGFLSPPVGRRPHRVGMGGIPVSEARRPHRRP